MATATRASDSRATPEGGGLGPQRGGHGPSCTYTVQCSIQTSLRDAAGARVTYRGCPTIATRYYLTISCSGLRPEAADLRVLGLRRLPRMELQRFADVDMDIDVDMVSVVLGISTSPPRAASCLRRSARVRVRA